ncbi:MAG: hypothetical protein PGMFKBFP_01752 [Anaerolineales bacterium]|nr:hypothetical protein [Anaerolineales bacterium]
MTKFKPRTARNVNWKENQGEDLPRRAKLTKAAPSRINQRMNGANPYGLKYSLNENGGWK